MKPPPRISDRLWSRLEPLIAEHDPPLPRGRHRIPARQALDAIVYLTVAGAAWNTLPEEYGDDSSVFRTYQRWQRSGLLDELFAVICEEAAVPA